MPFRSGALVLLSGLLGGLAFGEPPADEARLRGLVEQLDDDDVAKRDEATKLLIESPEPVEPLLEAAEQDKSPEVRGRAGRILRERKIRMILHRPEDKRLLETLDDVTSGDPAKRREALKSWVDGLSRTATTVEALLEMNAIDPNGMAGAANEALNWLCAPRLTFKLSQYNAGVSGQPCSAQKLLKSLFGKIAPLTPSEAATPLLQQAMTSGTVNGMLLDDLREVCELAGVSYRFDDAKGGVTLETAAETNAFWSKWWADTRGDEMALRGLGLAALPDAAPLTKEQLVPWLEALDSPDAAKARVARAFLKELPEALFPEIDARAKAGSVAAGDLRDRLAMRKVGRVAFARWLDGKGKVVSARLDGSDERVLVEDTGQMGELSVASDGSAIFAVRIAKDHRSTAWRLDPEGRVEPSTLGLEGTGWMMAVSGNGRWAATTEDGGTMQLLEAGKTEPLQFGGAASWPAVWSSDGRRVAWNSTKNGSVWIFDTETRKPLEIPGCVPSTLRGCLFRWSPDGASLAVARQKEDAVVLDVVDAATGNPRSLGAAVPALLTLCWSPDGKQLAFASAEPDGTGGKLWFADAQTGTTKPASDPASTRHPDAWAAFASDGRSLLYRATGSAWLVDASSGSSAPFKRLKGIAIILPGQDWILTAEGDVQLHHPEKSRVLTIVETLEEEIEAVFVPGKKR